MRMETDIMGTEWEWSRQYYNGDLAEMRTEFLEVGWDKEMHCGNTVGIVTYLMGYAGDGSKPSRYGWLRTSETNLIPVSLFKRLLLCTAYAKSYTRQ